MASYGLPIIHGMSAYRSEPGDLPVGSNLRYPIHYVYAYFYNHHDTNTKTLQNLRYTAYESWYIRDYSIEMPDFMYAEAKTLIGFIKPDPNSLYISPWTGGSLPPLDSMDHFLFSTFEEQNFGNQFTFTLDVYLETYPKKAYWENEPDNDTGGVGGYSTHPFPSDVEFTTKLLGITVPLEWKYYTYAEMEALDGETLFEIKYNFMSTDSYYRYGHYGEDEEENYTRTIIVPAQSARFNNLYGLATINPSKPIYGFKLQTEPKFQDPGFFVMSDLVLGNCSHKILH